MKNRRCLTISTFHLCPCFSCDRARSQPMREDVTYVTLSLTGWKRAQTMMENEPWATSQYNGGLSRYGNFHYKDNLYSGNSYTEKITSLYWEGTLVHSLRWAISHTIITTVYRTKSIYHIIYYYRYVSYKKVMGVAFMRRRESGHQQIL